MGIFNSLIILQLMFVLYFQFGSIKSLPEVKISSDDLHSSKFSHLTIHRDRGFVFLSAGNRFYKLSRDLKLSANVSTGQTSDITNMLINDKNSKFIACGGTHGYWCLSYDVNSSFLDKQQTILSHGVRNCKNASIVAFLGNNNSGQNEDGKSKIYIALSYCGNTFEDPTLIVKTIEKTVGYAVDFNNGALNLEKTYTKYINNYKVNYVYGFSSGIYNYILTTQQNPLKTEPSYISKLIRICSSDENAALFQGYVEIPIECGFPNDQLYNLVEAASVGKPSSDLAKSMNISSDDDVLFGVFSKSQNDAVPFGKLDNHSALCIYSLKAINDKFADNILNCYNGNGYHGFNNSNQCIKSDLKSSNYCPLIANMPLIGNISITTSPSVTFDLHPTAITTSRKENYTAIFVGTRTGELLNIVANNINNGCLEEVLSIDAGSPVNPDLLFSSNDEFLYVMTEHHLTRMNVLQNLICSKSCLISINHTEFKSNMIIHSGEYAFIAFPTPKFCICETAVSKLKCLINIEGKCDTKQIVMKNNYFYCENTTYTYAKNTPNINVTVEMQWKTPTHAGILSKNSAILYKCQLLAKNCTSCMDLNADYNCRWCQSSNTCEFKQNCDDQRKNHHYTCPAPPSPSILHFSPQQGLWGGSTHVTITGERLGVKFEDIGHDIEVASVTCTPLKDKYAPAKSITCITGKAKAPLNQEIPTEGPVVISVNNKLVTSKQHFKFVDPKILEISPTNGSINGGTKLTIKGKNLDAAKLIQVFIDDTECSIFSNTSEEIKCITESSTEKEAWVNVKFDQNIRKFTNHTYKYVKDLEKKDQFEDHADKNVSPYITTEVPEIISEVPEVIPNTPQNTHSALKILICVIACIIVFSITALLFYLFFQRRSMKKLLMMNQKLLQQENEMDMKALATKQSMDESSFY